MQDRTDCQYKDFQDYVDSNKLSIWSIVEDVNNDYSVRCYASELDIYAPGTPEEAADELESQVLAYLYEHEFEQDEEGIWIQIPEDEDE